MEHTLATCYRKCGRSRTIACVQGAATAIRTGSRLLTRNVGHFPMFPGLQEPY